MTTTTGRKAVVVPALVSPLVLAPTLVLLAAFVAGWQYRFGDLPPVRASVVVALAALGTAYSVASLPELLSEPVASLAVVVAAFALLSVGRYVWRRAGA